MRRMFMTAESFDVDISKWDVSSVRDMHAMFLGAAHFKRILCGAAWVDSKARQTIMFKDTAGSISTSVCAITTIAPVFSPQSRDVLKGAVVSIMSSEICDRKPQEQTQGSTGDSNSEDKSTPVPQTQHP